MRVEREGERFRLRFNAQNCLRRIVYEGVEIHVPKPTGREVVTDWLDDGVTAEDLQATVNLAHAESLADHGKTP